MFSKQSKKYLYYMFFIFFCALCLFMHLYKLNVIPYGIHVDEMGMGYDAWCLANFGVDRYAKSFPVYLINFGGGQSPLYAYLCALLIRIFGFSVWVLRIPAAIFAFITVFFGYKIVKFRWSHGTPPPLFL